MKTRLNAIVGLVCGVKIQYDYERREIWEIM